MSNLDKQLFTNVQSLFRDLVTEPEVEVYTEPVLPTPLVQPTPQKRDTLTTRAIEAYSAFM